MEGYVYLGDFLKIEGVADLHRKGNNVWVKNKHFTPSKAHGIIKFTSRHRRPNSGYTRDPFKPEIIDGKLFGLGSNDAGGPLVSLIAAFLHFYDQQGS